MEQDRNHLTKAKSPWEIRSMMLTLVFALSGILLAAASAKADSFSFSFTGGGNVPGTVTGEILGLVNNATGAASKVVITSYPAAMDASDLGPAPIDVTAWSNIFFNSFTETNGEITSAIFQAKAPNGENGYRLLDLTPSDGIQLQTLNASLTENLYVIAGTNLADDHFKPLTAQTPEPGTLSIFLLGVLWLSGMLARKMCLRRFSEPANHNGPPLL